MLTSYINLIEKHFYNPKWKEVFLLVAGLLDCADELLFLMRRKTEELLEIVEVNNLMIISEASLLSSDNKCPKIVRLNFAAFIALKIACVPIVTLDIDNALTRIRALEGVLNFGINTDIALTRVLVRAHAVAFILDLDSNKVNYPRLHALALDLDLSIILLKRYIQENNLNKQIALKVQNYFLGNLLIINCLESANFVSKPIREKMLHDMFLPKQEAEE